MNKKLVTSLVSVGFFALVSINSALADTTIDTGNTSTDVNISNKAGMNVAQISGSTGGTTHIIVDGNGAFSDNAVNYSKDSSVSVSQNNDTDISNNVNITNNTGGNNASGSTASYWWNKNDDDVSVDTGDATADVDIKNEAGLNVAHVSGCNDCVDSTHLKIYGNGAFSDNSINYNSDNDLDIDQNNDTDIDNNVNIHNNTGDNNAGEYDKYKPHSYKKSDYDHDKKDDYDKDDHNGYKDSDKNHDYDKDYDHKYHKPVLKHDYKKDNDDEKYSHDKYDKKDDEKYSKDLKYLKYDFLKNYDHNDKDNDHKEYKKSDGCYPNQSYFYQKDYKSDECDYGQENEPKKHVVYKPKYDKKDHDYSYKKGYDHDKKFAKKYDNDKCGKALQLSYKPSRYKKLTNYNPAWYVDHAKKDYLSYDRYW